MSELVQGNPAQTDVKANAFLDGLRDKEIRRYASRRRAGFVLGGLALAALVLVVLVGELQPHFARAYAALSAFGAAHHWPPLLLTVLGMSIPAVILMGLMQATAGFLVWWERKVAGHMQQRLGPMETGGWHGWAQVIADGIKLFLKETFRPEAADPWVYRLAPAIVFVPAYASFAPIPFGRGLSGLNFDISLLYVLAVSGLSTVGVLMAGWGSANKFSILGGLRAAAQVVSFEVPRVLSVVPVIMWAGTLSLTGIVATQSLPVAGWFPRWFIFYPVVGQIAFVIYLITTIAETNRVPFDVPEAESELVAGFHTEYGGMQFAIFFLAEYAYVFSGSLLGTALFLGGGAPLFPALGFIPSWTWFLGKTFLLMFIFLWSRWTFPRLRVDRVMDLCWKVFLPWTLINMLFMAGAILWRMK